jgi:universal stress protein A
MEPFPIAQTSAPNIMKADLILCPTDFSPLAETALQLASSMAAAGGATLLIVHVAKLPAAFDGETIDGQYVEQLKRSLEMVQPTESGVRCEHMLLMGDPTEAIVRLAKTECADFIVMGTHGRTGLSRIFLGSVAEAVVRRAPCPVLIARHPAPLEVLVAS